MRLSKTITRLAAAGVLLTLPLAVPRPACAGRLGADMIALFPKDIGEFAYADLKKARTLKWFPQLQEQMLPDRFRQFEKFLASAGIALGNYNPGSTEAYFKRQKLPTFKSRGYTLYAFGTGSGPNDLFFFFLDSSTAAFGHRALLEKMIEVRFGGEEGLLRNDKFYPLINEVNGAGVVWAVLNPAYTRLAMQQLAPEVEQFPEAAKIVRRMENLLITVDTSGSIDGKFQAVCGSTEDANILSQLLQAGLLYKRYQASQDNPELAQLLDRAQIAPAGDRAVLRMSLSDEQMTSLIKRNTFALKL